MLFRPNVGADSFQIEVHRQIPSNWPSAATPDGSVCHIFQTREFLMAWGSSFGRHARYSAFYIDVCDGSGHPLMLLPLVIEQRLGVRTLSFIDQGHADYNAPVVYPRAANLPREIVPALWDRILSLLPAVDVVRLEKMPDHILGVPNPLFALAEEPNGESCHGNDLTKTLAEVERTLLSPRELRSKQKSLEKIAPVRFIVAEESERRQQLLDTLIGQKQRRFEETRVPGFAEKPDALAFLRQATEIFGRSGNLFICALTVGDDVTAIQWGLKQGGVLYALMTSFADGRWVKYSCGRILNYRLLQWLKQEGYTYLDQGFGDEPYKLQNCDTTVPLYRTVTGRSLLGRNRLRLLALGSRLHASAQWEMLRQLKWVVLRGMRRGIMALRQAGHADSRSS
jgi:CelD/BcsL family acetyltransferase involved in cellulose biosynthesis